MKKLLSILVVMFFIMTNGISQTIIEGFEGTFPPEGWTIEGLWITNTYRHYEGTTSAYVADGAIGGRLIMPIFSATDATVLSFYMGATYPSYASLTTCTIEVTTSLEEAAWQTVATINYPSSDLEFEYREVSLAEYADQDIYVCFHVVNNNGAGTLIDNVSLANLTCPRPTDLTVVPTISSATLTWLGISNANSYDVQIAVEGQSLDNAEIVSVSETSYQATDLLTATTYKARVRNVCGDDEISNWSDILTFSTLCAEELTIPYTEEFANLNCWTVMSTAELWGTSYPSIEEGWGEGIDDGNVLTSSGDGVALFANNSPIGFDVSETEIRFKARAYYNYVAPTMMLGYVTNLQDTSTFVPLDTILITASDYYSEYSVNTSTWELEEGINYYFAIKIMVSDSWDGVYLDNVIINEIPDCPAPERSSVAVVANGDNAVVSWVDNNEEHDAWLVYYKQETEEEWLSVEASEQTITLTELLPQTTYQVYVMTDCGTDDNTDQTYTVSFTTTALPIVLPYFQDFEDPTNVSEISLYNSDGYNEWAIGTATAYTEDEETIGGSMYISKDNGVTYEYDNNNWDISIASLLVYFEPGYEYELSFDYKVNGEIYDFLQLYVLTPELPLEEYYNGQTISEELYEVTEWTNYNYSIPASWIGTTKQILFYWKNNYASGQQPPAAIDNIRISRTTCVRPTNVALGEITENTATISWEGESDTYTIRYRLLGSDAEFTEETTSENSITLTDLQPASVYEYTLQSTCNEELSPLTDVAQFSTNCGAIEGVWFEDFESVHNDEILANIKFACWDALVSSSGYYNGSFPRIYWEGYEPAAHSGEVTLEFKGNGLLLLPRFAADLNTLQLSFFANTTASTVENAGLFEVGYITDLQDTSTFVSIATVTPVGLERSESVMVGPFQYGDIEETEGRIALRYTAVNSGESWNLDDFTVEPIPACPSPIPTSVTVSNITSEGATIAWVDQDIQHTQWIVYYKAEGEETYSSATAVDQLLELTGLEPATSYTLYVQTDCGTEDNLSQTLPVTFSTIAEPITDFPYYQDFENLEEVPFGVNYLISGGNAWVVGNATGLPSSEDEEDTEATSLYISNTNGTTFNYDEYDLSHAYVSMPITFGDDAEYIISFDYKVVGEGNWDYLSVVLVNPDSMVTSGQPTGIVLLDKAHDVEEWTTFIYSSSSLSNTTKNLVFYWKNDGGGTYGFPAAIDNISITSSSCTSPTGFTLSATTTATEASFAWEESDNTAWTLYYKVENETEYTSVEVTTNPYTLTDLEPSTAYTAYLVTNCSGEESAPTPEVMFETQCLSITEYPFYEGFEASGLPICWTTEIVSGYNDWYPETSYDRGFGVEAITPAEGNQLISFSASTGNSARLISPIMDLTSLDNPYLKFSHLAVNWGSDIDELKVQYRTSPDGTWTDLVHYTTVFTDWTIDSVALPNPSETYQIAFLGISNYGYGVGLDAVHIYEGEGEGGGGTDPEPEPCDAPTNLTVNNITANSADVTWNGTAETYELKLNGGEAETLTTTSKQLIGLPENFTITVEVRSICGNQQSEWVSTTFTTLDGEDPEPEPCDAPTNLSASNITETTAEITWNGTATTYEFKLNGGEAETLTTTTKALTGLTPNTAYTVEVRSICEEQTSAWVSANFTTLEEQVVIELGEVTTSPATEVGNTSATLNGALVSAGNAENFTVGFALATVADFTLEDNNVQNITATLNANTFSQAVNDLAEGQTYFYRAYITNEAGTAYGTVETFTLSSLTDAIAGTITATIYPNPATDNATMEIVGLDQDAKIVISDLQGRILSQEAINAGETHYTINVSNMASGVYYIRIVTDKAVSTQKLIVE